MPICLSSLFSCPQAIISLVHFPLNAENLDSMCPVGCQSCFPVSQGIQAVLGESTLPCLLTDRSSLQSAGEQHTDTRVTPWVCCPPAALEQVLMCSAPSSKVPLSLGASESLRTLELSGQAMCSREF